MHPGGRSAAIKHVLGANVKYAPQVVYVPAPPRVVYYAPPVVSFGYSYRSGPSYGYSHHGRGRR